MTGRERYVAALAAGHDGLFWWHAAICDELDRIGTITLDADGQARPAYPVTGLAGNLRGMTRVQLTRRPARPTVAPVDVRTPGGRPLPY